MSCIASAAEYLHGEVLDLMKLKVKASSKGKKGAPAPDKTVSLPPLASLQHTQGIFWGRPKQGQLLHVLADPPVRGQPFHQPQVADRDEMSLCHYQGSKEQLDCVQTRLQLSCCRAAALSAHVNG